MDYILTIWEYIYDLFQWAWQWTIPTTNIQPIPLSLFIFLTEFVLDIVFPVPSDMVGG